MRTEALFIFGIPILLGLIIFSLSILRKKYKRELDNYTQGSKGIGYWKVLFPILIIISIVAFAVPREAGSKISDLAIPLMLGALVAAIIKSFIDIFLAVKNYKE